MHRVIKNIFILISSFGLLSAFSVLAVLWAFSNNLPDYKFLKSYKPSVSSKVYSGDGELVNDFSTEKRIFVPYNAISEKVIRWSFSLSLGKKMSLFSPNKPDNRQSSPDSWGVTK